MRDINKTGLRSLLPLYITIFIGFIGYSLMITVFTPLFIHPTSDFVGHFSDHQRIILLGIVLCLYPLGQFIGSPILGAFSDSFGRKPLLLFSLLLSIAGYFFIALALNTASLGLLMVSLFVVGLFEGNVVLAQSAIADRTTADNRGRLFGYINLSASSAYVVGPLVGGKLADPQLIPWFNAATPFWCVFALLIITFFLISYCFHEDKCLNKNETIHYFKAITNLLSVFIEKEIRILFLANFLFYFAAFGFLRCYPIYLVDSFHLNVSKASEFIAWAAVPFIVTNLGLNGFLLKRFPPKSVSIVAMMLTFIALISIVIPSNINALWFTLFLSAFAIALGFPACVTFLSLSTAADKQGQILGNNQSIAVGAEALSGLLGGLVAAIAVKLALIIPGILAAVAGIILMFYKRMP